MAKQESIGFQILRAMRQILRRTSQHSREIARESGLSVPQMLCLKAIDDLGGEIEVSVAMVASSVQLTPATVSRILDRLEGMQLIVRERRSKDRRKVCLSLTEDGRRELDQLPTPLHEQFLRRLESLDSAERQNLLESLLRIVELMDAQEIDASPVLTPDADVAPRDQRRAETQRSPAGRD